MIVTASDRQVYVDLMRAELQVLRLKAQILEQKIREATQGRVRRRPHRRRRRQGKAV